MLFETTTSIYRLTREEIGDLKLGLPHSKYKMFVVEKLALKSGVSSRVQPGEQYAGDQIVIDEDGLTLYLRGRLVLKTSPLVF